MMLAGEHLPLVDVVGPQHVDFVDVGDVEDGLVAGGIRKLHQNLVQQNRLWRTGNGFPLSNVSFLRLVCLFSSLLL